MKLRFYFYLHTRGKQTSFFFIYFFEKVKEINRNEKLVTETKCFTNKYTNNTKQIDKNCLYFFCTSSILFGALLAF